jgi:hypothetical protein
MLKSNPANAQAKNGLRIQQAGQWTLNYAAAGKEDEDQETPVNIFNLGALPQPAYYPGPAGLPSFLGRNGELHLR